MPALSGSKVTAAIRFVAAPAGRFGAGACDSAIVSGACVMVTIAKVLFVGSAVETAVIVTVLLPVVGSIGGIAAGAVYMAAPLAKPLVWAGIMEPHAPGLAHVTVKSSPKLESSLLTNTTTLALAPVFIEDGGARLNHTEMAGLGVI